MARFGALVGVDGPIVEIKPASGTFYG